MSTENGTGLRINKLEIESFLKIRHRTIDAHGRHIVAHGPNFVGKSTIVRSIWTAIKGLSSKQFPDPIHWGETKAKIRLDLGEFLIERKITKSGSSLTVTRADGSKVGPKPQQFLDGLFRELSLDPIAFVRLKPREQVDVVLSIAGVKPPVARVQEITGEQHPAYAGESAYDYLMRLSQDERGLYYSRRREKGREVDQKDKALLEQREQLDRLGGPLKADQTPASAADLLKQVESLQAKADKRRAVADDAADKRREVKACDDKLKALDADRQRLELEDQRLAEQIKQLEARRSGLAAERTQVMSRLAKVQDLKRDWEEDAVATEAALEQLSDPAPQIADLRQRIQAVEADNRKTISRRMATEQLDRLLTERERAQGEHQRIEGILTALRELRAHLLDGVDLGVQELEIGEDRLHYKGAPFPTQCSTAEGYRVACALAAAARPGLNVMFADNAEALDENERAALLQSADEAGMQLILCEVVRGEKGLSIDVIEEAGEEAEQPALALKE